MSLTHKSQSALEYMMTYGWAILVIVIVAAVLYSLGIFSPSSSLSTTVTGFANTPISSAAFTNNGGLAFSVGDLVGYPIEITNVTEITASGSKITILPNITVSPSQTKVIIIPKAFSSSTQGSHESVSLTITYTEPGQIFPGPYTSTGTVSGTTPTLSFPANQTFAAVSELTITNSQTTATPSPFQQMINITSTSPGWDYISQDFGQNVEFFYPNGTTIPSWLENYTSSHALWWVKVGSIPASSSITIYMGFAQTSTNLFNTVNDGEAPQLSSTYAEYDDGANVFNNYWNFAGTTLPSNLAVSESGASYSINNGLTCSGNGGSIFVYYNTEINPQAYVIDAYFDTGTANSDGHNELIGWGTSFSGGNGNVWWGWTDGVFVGTNAASPAYFGTGGADGSAIAVTDSSQNINYPFIGSIYWTSSSSVTGWYNYGNQNTDTTDVPTIGNAYAIIGYISSGGSITYYWARIRAYPPNGVMPSVSFGSVS